LVKAEELKTYPHLAKIKANVCTNLLKKFIRKRLPKKLDKDEQILRANAGLALDQLFKKKI
jgi:hypothetical protein